jgi:ABC-type arginine transport system permease subunit
MMFFYAIVMGVIYLIFQTWVNYRSEKIEREISNQISWALFEYK